MSLKPPSAQWTSLLMNCLASNRVTRWRRRLALVTMTHRQPVQRLWQHGNRQQIHHQQQVSSLWPSWYCSSLAYWPLKTLCQQKHSDIILNSKAANMMVRLYLCPSGRDAGDNVSETKVKHHHEQSCLQRGASSSKLMVLQYSCFTHSYKRWQ